MLGLGVLGCFTSTSARSPALRYPRLVRTRGEAPLRFVRVQSHESVCGDEGERMFLSKDATEDLYVGFLIYLASILKQLMCPNVNTKIIIYIRYFCYREFSITLIRVMKP